MGRWGRIHKDYLEQHHAARYSYLLLSGKLWTYLADLNEQAQERMECMITQMKAAEGITEELKACLLYTSRPALPSWPPPPRCR